MKVDNWLIGSDIEVFIQNENTKKFISSCGDATNGYKPLMPGTKYAPHYIDAFEEYAVERDNVSVEFLIPPTRESEAFINSINFMMKYIKDNLPAGLVPVAVASAHFDKDQLDTEGASTFGCDRDMNAWTKRFNPKPDTNTTLRSNGLHIHIGYDNPTFKTSVEIIRAMDYFVGLGSLYLDKDTARRNLYGRAGSFRIKPYGVEYRTLSSALIGNSQHLRYVFESTIKAINFINAGGKIDIKLGRQVVEAINNNNTELADKIFEIVDITKLETTSK